MLKIKEIIHASNGKIVNGSLEIIPKSYEIDSRNIKEGDFFIPIIGENVDAHKYIIDCVKKGAIGYFIDINCQDYEKINEESIKLNPNIIIIAVEDTLKALINSGKYNREKHIDIPIVTVVGSVGKTSTREMITSILKDEKEKQRKLDLLRYQLNEIQEAKLKVGEEEKLDEKRNIFMNSEKIAKNLSEADMAIGENTIDIISSAIRALEKIADIDKRYEETASNLKESYYQIQEISRDIRSYLEDVDFDEQEREEIETRLDTIYNLKRKYGNNIEEILKYADEVEEEIKKIENVDEYNNKLKKEQKQLQEEMTQIAEQISEIRKKYAQNLNEKINQELIDLEMKNAKINVKVDYKANEFFEDGKDYVEIFIKTNVGENENELTKIASGGEMSRIMLAIKKVLAEVDNVSVLIFDEIDTGISGKAAKSVASKLKSISKNHQVLCISHLAAIAASADSNYFISKKVENERTATSVKLLNEQEVLQEIARISSGEINEVTLQYANELRKNIA